MPMASSAMGSNQHVVQTPAAQRDFPRWNHHNGASCRRRVASGALWLPRTSLLLWMPHQLIKSVFQSSTMMLLIPRCRLPKSSVVFLSYRKFYLPCWQSFFLHEAPLGLRVPSKLSLSWLPILFFGSCCWRIVAAVAPCGSFNGAIHRGHRNRCRG